jgi:hypothetical protein
MRRSEQRPPEEPLSLSFSVEPDLKRGEGWCIHCHIGGKTCVVGPRFSREGSVNDWVSRLNLMARKAAARGF